MNSLNNNRPDGDKNEQAAKQNEGKGNNTPGKPSGNDKLHIFINGVKYDESDGVKSVMTGREIIGLIPIEPADNAEITEKNSDVLLSLDAPISLKNGDHFEVIRKSVIAGIYDAE